MMSRSKSSSTLRKVLKESRKQSQMRVWFEPAEAFIKRKCTKVWPSKDSASARSWLACASPVFQTTMVLALARSRSALACARLVLLMMIMLKLLAHASGRRRLIASPWSTTKERKSEHTCNFWRSDESRKWQRNRLKHRDHIAMNGSFLGVAGKYTACWAVVQLDLDGGNEPGFATYGRAHTTGKQRTHVEAGTMCYDWKRQCASII